jgi:hypothetical protein
VPASTIRHHVTNETQSQNAGALPLRRFQMIDELVTEFPWGVLLATDSESTDMIPSWDSEADLVTASEAALVVRVRHGDEGQVVVRVGEDVDEARGESVFDGRLRLASGLLRVGDALGQSVIVVRVAPGEHRVRVFVSPAQEAESVDLVLGG